MGFFDEMSEFVEESIEKLTVKPKNDPKLVKLGALVDRRLELDHHFEQELARK